MARKIKLTRPELKRQRDLLGRFQRYLPMLKLKQQQLQATVLQTEQRHRQALVAVRQAEQVIEPYRPLLAALAGINVDELARPVEQVTHTSNVAGVALTVLEDVTFGPLRYSLFGTPPWVDRAILDHRELNRRRAHAEALAEQIRLLRRELMRVIQRVNLFEKVMIPQAREAIRIIRIRLGDEQTAGVARAKMAKAKLAETADMPEQPAPSGQEVLA